MGTDQVMVHTTQLQTSSQTAKTGSTDTSNLSNDMGTAISDLVTSLAAVDVLSGVASSLETFTTGLMATLECFATGLQVIDNGLSISATAFKGLDANLSKTFSTLESQLGYYTGYETHFTMPTVHVPTNITYKATTISFQAPPAHQSFWGGVGNFFSGVGHFVTTHPWQVAGAAGLVVLGVAGTIFTGGASDVAADSAAAALLTEAGADTVIAGTEAGTVTVGAGTVAAGAEAGTNVIPFLTPQSEFVLAA